jgi:hypothetical protein
VKALLAGCAVVIAVLIYDNIQRGREIELLRAQTLSPASAAAPVTPKAVAPVKAASMADQAACAKQAASEFKREGFKDGSMDDFTSHFSAATGHCYMVTTSTAATNNTRQTHERYRTHLRIRSTGTTSGSTREGRSSGRLTRRNAR